MSFLIAVGFLTRVPVPVGRVEPSRLAGAAAWFPVVGASVGLVVAGAYAGLLTFLPSGVSAALALTAGILLTGAFHEDGLADTIDAVGGGKDADDVRRILKDPRHGSYGVLAMTLSVVIRWTALASLDAWTALAILPCAHAIARACAVGLMGVVPAAPGEGLGASYTASLRGSHVAMALTSGIVIGALTAGVWVLPALALGAVCAGAIGRLALSKIGGISGDFLGAAEQIAEGLIFVLGAAIVANAWPGATWWR